MDNWQRGVERYTGVNARSLLLCAMDFAERRFNQDNDPLAKWIVYYNQSKRMAYVRKGSEYAPEGAIVWRTFEHV